MMGKKAFISLSFQHREELEPIINKITDVLREFNIDAKIFVNDYAFEAGEEIQMMKIACQEIAQCNLLIAEVSHKAISIGVEVGYAVGLGKPVIYICTPHKCRSFHNSCWNINVQHHLFHTHGSRKTTR